MKNQNNIKKFAKIICVAFCEKSIDKGKCVSPNCNDYKKYNQEAEKILAIVEKAGQKLNERT